MANIIMPKFEMSQETGTVARWLKSEGDVIEKGEAILEVETDKVTMEVESPASGVLRDISAHPGDVVPIGRVIARVDDGRPATDGGRRTADGGQRTADDGRWTADGGRPTADGGQRTADDGRRTADGGRPTADGGRPPATPIAERIAAEKGIDLATIRGSGKGGQITREDVEAAIADRRQTTDDRRSTTGDGRRTADVPSSVVDRLSSAAVPAARRRARELGVDLRQVRGSGPGGRIQSVDVEGAMADRRPPTADDGPPSAVGRPPSAVGPTVRRLIPLNGMRRTIAQRMRASVNEAPQFNLSVDMNMTRALAVVEDFKQAPNAPKVTLTAFLIRACAWALARHPAVNASYTPDGIVEYADVNIGIAVALDDGLVVPVIRQAATLDLPAIVAQLADLAARARAGKLTPADMQDGTFSISNLGMFAVDRFTAIVNPPQAAILAVGRTTKRFVPDANDQPVAAPICTFTISADHRAVDGAQIGRFLGDLQHAIERPGVML
jgi:pyruvate dehydrogenase E2 component (dihydrolipoamide acetyltransferase)